MTYTLKNRFFISLLAPTLVSMALLSTAYAAEITVATRNVDGDTISSNSALLEGIVDATSYSADVWFEYGANGSLDKSTQKQKAGLNFGAVSFSNPVYNLEPNTAYSFRAVAQNTNTNSSPIYGETLNFTTNSNQIINSNSDSNSNSSAAPEVKTNPAYSMDGNSAILDAYIKSNGSNTVAWFEYGTTDGLGNKTEERYVSVAEYQTDFQHKATDLMPNTFYYFRAAARNNYGATYGNNYVFRTENLSNGMTFAQPTASTTSAILVRETSALLNGNIIPNNAETSVWFEWSENPEMTIGLNRNASQSAGSGDNEVYAAYSLGNLVLNKTYYFRVVAQNSYGTTKGNVNKFTTVKTATPIQIPISPAPANYVQPQSSGKSLILEAEFDNNNPSAGTKTIYAISYTNKTNLILKDAILKITLPNEIDYMASSFVNVGQDGNVLTFKLGDIASKKSGIVSIKIKITDLARAQNLKFNAEISYSNNGIIGKETLMNELQISEYSLTASVLETLGSLFSNLFVDFILGLLIGVGAYHYYVISKKGKADTEDPLK
ncbi:MAG: hypothetical protein AAB621_02490 [Patescibacteria group bacterium]